MKNTVLFELIDVNDQKSNLKILRLNKTLSCTGSVLEAQMELQNGWYLILTTENSPYDEALHVTLLDRQFEVLDQVELSQDMTPGIVKELQVIGDWQVQFLFNRTDPYVLEVKPNGFMIPSSHNSAKRPVRRIFGRKYLQIK